MPDWLIGPILSLVLKFGIPFAVDWLRKKFGLGADSKTVQILSSFVQESRLAKNNAKALARQRLNEHHGVTN